MNNVQPSSVKDSIIVFLIILVFLSVILILYMEFIKYYKISNAEKNFYVVKEELEKEIDKCNDKKENWSFGFSCQQKPTIKNISDYFSQNNKLINPYDNQLGVNGKAGSIQVDIKDKLLILSVDIDASGGIDITHRMHLN